MFLIRAYRLGNLIANRHGEFRLRAGEALRTVFKANIHTGRIHLVGQLANELRAVDGYLGNCVHVLVEDDLALQRRCRIVKMHDYVLCSVDCLERLADKMLSRLNKHLNCHVVRNKVAFDKCAEYFIFGLACRRESHFYLLESDSDKLAEHLDLFI